MLQTIRERAQGWFAWVIVILISVPFALWGIQSYLGGGSANIKASVNDRDISEQEFDNSYRQFREELRQRLGKDYRPDQLDDKLVRKEALQSIIRNELIDQLATKLGMRTSDDMLRELIKSAPAFQVGGRFNQAVYENAARRQGLTTEGYELQLRHSLAANQLMRAIGGSEIITSAEMAERTRLVDQQRQAKYLIIPLSKFLASAEIKPEEIESYYNGNRENFMSPERVKLEYLELDIKNLADTVKVDDAELLGYYEQHKSDYLLSPERRRASHILITVKDPSNKAELEKARAEAEDALRRVRAGADFAKVAKEMSQDPGSASKGGDLGFFSKGMMDPAFETAAFKLKKGEISGLVQSSFGFHIIKLTDIQPAKGKTFEQARPELVDAYRKEEAERKFYEYAERLGDLTYEDPSSLEPAADALGLKIRQSAWVGRDGGDGILADTRVMAAAFSDDVLEQRQNSELLELDSEHVLVLRVVDHEESSVRPLEKVRNDIEAVLKNRAAAGLAEQTGKEMLVSLAGGATLDKLAAERGVKIHQAGSIGRNAQDVPSAILGNLFIMPHPQGDAPVYDGIALQNGDYAVIALSKVIDGTIDSLQPEEVKAAKESMRRALGQSDFDHMIANMRDNSKIVIPEEQK
ncbi:MAG: SurA N-terminal domain-containing protein [Gammaproteobacteria bacterium]